MKEKGITLIALIVTIIVIIILAAVTANILVSSGIIDKGMLAAKKYQQAQYNEIDEIDKILKSIGGTENKDILMPNVTYAKPEGENGWYKSNIEIAVSSENTDNITNFAYKLADKKGNIVEQKSNLNKEGDTITITKDGEFTLAIWAENDKNERSEIKVIENLKKDAAGPQGLTLSIDEENVGETEIPVTATVANTVSGIAEYEFYIKEVGSATYAARSIAGFTSGDNDKYTGDVGQTQTHTYTGLTKGTEYQIYVKVKDKAGTWKDTGEAVQTVKTAGIVISDTSGANSPENSLKQIAGKTYVTWSKNGEAYTKNEDTEIPDDWYDYENGQWANIKTSQNGLEAYWVWIPRYEYIVPTSTTATEIEVRFIGTDKKEGTAGYTKQSDGRVTSSDGYTIHPAFTNSGNGGFGELDGIWVAKFEASSDNPSASYGGGDNPNLKVQVKPSVQSWRNLKVSTIFTVCRNMTSAGNVLAGSSIDSHMMKNTEWGAVAILSQSKYGVFNPKSSNGGQVYNNSNGYNSNKYIYTGYAGDGPNASTTYDSGAAPTNVYAYDTVNGTKASTTGTIYGVYDMAGGSWEYVAGVLSNYESQFGTGINKKYLDIYTNPSDSSTNYDGAKTGDATKETKGWNSDFAFFIDSSVPVFHRGRQLLRWHDCWRVFIPKGRGQSLYPQQFPSLPS